MPYGLQSKSIEKITPEGSLFKTSVFDENDKVIGYEEERELVHADSIIIAVSQEPKNKLVMTTHNLACSDKGLLITDENNMTTRAGVFVAGDVVHGS